MPEKLLHFVCVSRQYKSINQTNVSNTSLLIDNPLVRRSLTERNLTHWLQKLAFPLSMQYIVFVFKFLWPLTQEHS